MIVKLLIIIVTVMGIVLLLKGPRTFFGRLGSLCLLAIGCAVIVVNVHWQEATPIAQDVLVFTRHMEALLSEGREDAALAGLMTFNSEFPLVFRKSIKRKQLIHTLASRQHREIEGAWH